VLTRARGISLGAEQGDLAEGFCLGSGNPLQTFSRGGKNNIKALPSGTRAWL